MLNCCSFADMVEGGFKYCGNIIGGDAKGRYSGNG